MPVQIGQKLEFDFSDPLGLLSDCHRRIENFLGVLIRVCDAAKGRSFDLDERSALEKALTYFRDSAPKHTADEEESLFPRLHARTFDHPDDSLMTHLVVLEQDHEAAARDHQIVDSLVTRWLNSGSLSAPESLELSETLARLAEMYQRHIALEDQQLFPLAARLLRHDELSAVGCEMADRRSVKL